MLGLVCATLIIDTVSTSQAKVITYWFSQFSLLCVLFLVIYLFPSQPEVVFGGHFVSDPMSAMLKIAVCVVSLVAFFYSFDYLTEHGLIRGEYFILGLFAVLGMMVLISAYSLLSVYLGLELLSLSLYSMVALNRDSGLASEAAMKYFVLGALASGMLLYGISMLYGATGSIELPAVSRFIEVHGAASPLVVFGLAFVMVGIAFKLGAVPFHMWLPDVYEGAPTSVTLFVGTAPKIAAFAMAIRLLVNGMGPVEEDWQGMLVILSVFSMAAGNIIAISQSNIKRMLAYSTIAHVGFMLLGIISGTQSGYAGSMFYIMVYALMSLGAFGMVILLGRSGHEADQLVDFKGLARRSPWFAFVMMVLMFSLAGVPPFVGFWSKWFVIKEIVAVGHVWLAGLAVVLSVIGAFYYLRVIKLMYFDEPDRMTAIKASREMRLVLSLNGLAVLALGFLPGVLMSLCVWALGM